MCVCVCVSFDFNSDIWTEGLRITYWDLESSDFECYFFLYKELQYLFHCDDVEAIVSFLLLITVLEMLN